MLCFIFQGLQLFNIDIIREHGTKDKYYVIDINYFPGKLHFVIKAIFVHKIVCYLVEHY